MKILQYIIQFIALLGALVMAAVEWLDDRKGFDRLCVSILLGVVLYVVAQVIRAYINGNI